MENRLEQTNTIVGIATAMEKQVLFVLVVAKLLLAFTSKPSQIKSNPIKTNQIKSHKFYYGYSYRMDRRGLFAPVYFP